MPYIKQIEEHEATGALKKLYNEISSKRGKLSNILKIHSLDPRSMKAHLDLYVAVMFGRPKISREEREIIATVVSILNNCKYCQLHHAEALNHYWKNKARIEAFLKDFRSLDFSPRVEAMLNYAEKLTRVPSSVSEEDIEALRKVGLEDSAILNLNLTVSYFNFVNRIAEGLGVEFSLDEIEGYNY